MEQIFQCKGKDDGGNPCDKKVIYRYSPVQGSAGGRLAERSADYAVPGPTAIYLTCEDGHTGKYMVHPDAE